MRGSPKSLELIFSGLFTCYKFHVNLMNSCQDYLSLNHKCHLCNLSHNFLYFTYAILIDLPSVHTMFHWFSLPPAVGCIQYLNVCFKFMSFICYLQHLIIKKHSRVPVLSFVFLCVFLFYCFSSVLPFVSLCLWVWFSPWACLHLHTCLQLVHYLHQPTHLPSISSTPPKSISTPSPYH